MSDNKPKQIEQPNFLRTRQDKFWKNVTKILDDNSCWVWTGRLHKHGYGMFHYLGSDWLAHRISWFFSHGYLNPQLDVLHKCDNPPCVRPSHLFEGTHKVNMDDATKKGRMGRPMKVVNNS